MPDVEPQIPPAGDPFEVACDRFEAAWWRTIREQAQRPRLEDYLTGFEASDAAKLLRELLLLEWEYRQRRERLDLDEYTARFPENHQIVRATFRTFTGAEDDQAKKGPPKESSSIGASSSSGSRFQILKFHKQGGLGQVWIAEDHELNRQVAIKDIRELYADNLEVRSRFVTEAELTGKLEHPGIVPVYGLGQHPNGRPFYATKFIRGSSLADAIERFHSADKADTDATKRALQLRELLRRFVDICNTVEYAHSRGILHRDLKPDNILLGDYGETLVIDWGLAKVPHSASHKNHPAQSESDHKQVSADHSEGSDDSATSDENEILAKTSMHLQGSGGSTDTKDGSIMGTPPYMSPEQAAGGLSELGPASDVYSLGATLYCILTGKAPFLGGSEQDICWEVQQGRFPPPRKVQPDVPRPLEAVCLKAMARLTDGRYQSPSKLSDDINRWLADEPVRAMRENWWQRLGRWARRNRTWVQAGAVLLVLVTIVAVVASFLINAERERTEIARQRAETEWQRAEKERQLAETARQQKEEELERTRQSRYAIQVANAMKLEYKEPDRALELLNDLEICPKKRREFTWHHCYRRCRRDRLSFNADTEAVRLAAFGNQGETVIAVGAEGVVKIWDATTGKLLLKWQTDQTVTAAALVSYEEKSCLATAGDDGSIRIWDVPSSIDEDPQEIKPKAVLDDQREAARRLAFSRDGKTLASLHEGKYSALAIWDVADLADAAGDARDPNPRLLKVYDDDMGELTVSARAPSLAVAPDGKRVALGSASGNWPSGRLRIFNLEDTNSKSAALDKPWKTSLRSKSANQEGQSLDKESISCLAFKAASTDNPLSKGTIVFGCNHGALARFDPDRHDVDSDQAPFQTQKPVHHGSVTALALHPSPAASVVVTAGVGYSERTDIHVPYRPIVESLLEVCDGRTVISQTRYLAGISDLKEVTDLAFDATGERLLTVSTGAILTVFDQRPDWYRTRVAPPPWLTKADSSADGKILAIGFHPKEKILVTVYEDSSYPVSHWDRDSGKLLAFPFGQDPVLLAMPCGTILEPGPRRNPDSREEMQVMDPLDRQPLGVVSLDAGDVAVAFSAKQNLLAVRNSKQLLKIWNLKSGCLEKEFDDKAATSQPGPVAFAPSGRLLASAWDNQAGRVALWDPLTGTLVGSLQEPRHEISDSSPQRPRREISALAFSPDGAVLAVGHRCARKKSSRFAAGSATPAPVTLYDVSSCKVLATLKGHGGDVRGLAFSPKGTTLATGSEDGSIRLWDVKSGVPMASLLVDHASLPADQGAVSSVAFSPDGLTLATVHDNKSVVLWHTEIDAKVQSNRHWRDASELVRSLDERIQLIDETSLDHAIQQKSIILESIRADDTISKQVREHALELADGLLKKYRRETLEEVCSLKDASWDIVWSEQSLSAEYEKALHYAEEACRLKPKDGLLLSVLGAAQYRNGQYSKARQTLLQSEQLLKNPVKGAKQVKSRANTTARQRAAAGTVLKAHAVNLAFMTMISVQSKDLEAAKATLAESSDLIRKGADTRVRMVYKEAHDLVEGFSPQSPNPEN